MLTKNYKVMMLPNVMYVQLIIGLPEPINVIILN